MNSAVADRRYSMAGIVVGLVFLRERAIEKVWLKKCVLSKFRALEDHWNSSNGKFQSHRLDGSGSKWTRVAFVTVTH
jgi:hypothetical protein